MSDISYPHTFVQKTKAKASEVMANFDEVKTKYNAGIGSKLPAAGAAGQLVVCDAAGVPRYVTLSGDAAVSPDGVVAVFAVGDLKPTARSTPSAGWLMCDGAAVSRAVYAVLFAVIGTAHGPGDGVSTFNLPNMKGRVPAGLDQGQTEFDALGKAGGAKTHTLTDAQMPAHTHDFSGERQTNYNAGGNTGGMFNLSSGTSGDTDRTTGSAGSGAAHNNLQPYLVVNWMIRF